MTQEEFTQSVQAHEATLYRIASTLLSRFVDRQDAVQSAIALAWQHQSALRDETRFRPWITRIMIRECYRIQKKQRPLVLTDTIPEGYATPDRDEALHAAIAQLSDKLRVAIVLYYVEGMSHEEIAQALHIPKGTVKSRLNAGRTALGSILKEEISE